MNSAILAIAAVLPMALGTAPSGHEDALVVNLCNGGTIAIPLGDNEGEPEKPCHSKACHAGTCRKGVERLSHPAKD